MKVRTMFDVGEVLPSPSGDSIIDIFEKNKETDELEKVGEFDLQDFINSFESDCDVAKLVARYENGDINALKRVQAIYGDSTLLPKTPGECVNAYKALDFAEYAVKKLKANKSTSKPTNELVGENLSSQKGENE